MNSCVDIYKLKKMKLFTDILGKIGEAVHVHKWEYERHNAVIIMSCRCMVTEQGIIEEEPELRSTAPMRKKDFDKIVWGQI